MHHWIGGHLTPPKFHGGLKTMTWWNYEVRNFLEQLAGKKKTRTGIRIQLSWWQEE